MSADDKTTHYLLRKQGRQLEVIVGTLAVAAAAHVQLLNLTGMAVLDDADQEGNKKMQDAGLKTIDMASDLITELENVHRGHATGSLDLVHIFFCGRLVFF